ncbi:PucR family transcriptional regulator [Paenibacillus polymyxa]|uniref:PucR family transcriptional regulator n=1 Tax=Paenibacillus polymyxa TaxID=1406 RepID=UPI0022213F21|nr:helix-turn-helix domain-containing protein [Paenibacillus polymyxa]
MKIQKIIRKLSDCYLSLPEEAMQTKEISEFTILRLSSIFQADTAYIGKLSDLPKDFPTDTPLFCIQDCDALVDSYTCLTLLPNGLDLLNLSGKISSILAHENRLIEHMHTLISALYSNKGLQYLTNEASRIFGNPVIIVDAGYKLLAMCQAPIPSRPDIEQQRNLGYILDSNIESMKKSNLYELTRMALIPYYSRDPETNDCWITAFVYVHGIEFAQVSVMELDRKFTDIDFELVQFLCELVSVELQKNDFYNCNQGMMHSFLLSELLTGELNDANVIAMRLAHLEWTLTPYLRVLTLTDLKNGFFDGKVQLVAQHMIQLLPDSRWIVYQGRIVFLISLVDSSCKIIAEDKRILEFLQVNGLTASLSDCFSHLTFLRKYYKQCLTAIEIGFQLHSNKPVYMYEDYLCEHIGKIISEQNDLADFCHPVIQKLIAYDNAHKTSLLSTLEAYLQYVDTPNIAAKTLFIHRNTLFYRINRIRELFEIDLSDGDIRLKLQMTLHFLKLKTQRGDPKDQSIEG